MSLRQEFQNAINSAKAASPGFNIMSNGANPLNYKELHQFIGGDIRSGKTTLAMDYCKELAAASLILTADPVMVTGFQLENTQDLGSYFDNLRGRAVIIDEVNKMAEGEKDRLRDALIGRYGRLPCVLIFTDDVRTLTKFQTQNMAFMNRYQRPIIETGATLSDDEIKNFNKTRTAEKLARAQAQVVGQQAVRERSMRQWKEMKTVDVSLPAAIKPLKTASFRKKEAPSV